MYERVSVWAFVHEKAFWCRQGARRVVRLELPAAPSRRRGYIPAAVPSSEELSDLRSEEPLSSASLDLLFLVGIPKSLDHLTVPVSSPGPAFHTSPVGRPSRIERWTSCKRNAPEQALLAPGGPFDGHSDLHALIPPVQDVTGLRATFGIL